MDNQPLFTATCTLQTYGGVVASRTIDINEVTEFKGPETAVSTLVGWVYDWDSHEFGTPNEVSAFTIVAKFKDKTF